MIVTLTGKVEEKNTNQLVVNVNGVGYGLLVPLETCEQVTLGDNLKFYVFEYVRENTYDLYGFANTETKRLFEQLLDVNGVGPKMALSILSIGSVGDVRNAIASGNLKLIQSAPGVGKRVAERVVVELKDKVGLISTADSAALLTSENEAMKDKAVQALVALGYSVPEAVSALKPVDKELPTKERITLALKAR